MRSSYPCAYLSPIGGRQSRVARPRPPVDIPGHQRQKKLPICISGLGKRLGVAGTPKPPRPNYDRRWPSYRVGARGHLQHFGSDRTRGVAFLRPDRHSRTRKLHNAQCSETDPGGHCTDALGREGLVPRKRETPQAIGLTGFPRSRRGESNPGPAHYELQAGASARHHLTSMETRSSPT